MNFYRSPICDQRRETIVPSNTKRRKVHDTIKLRLSGSNIYQNPPVRFIFLKSSSDSSSVPWKAFRRRLKNKPTEKRSKRKNKKRRRRKGGDDRKERKKTNTEISVGRENRCKVCEVAGCQGKGKGEGKGKKIRRGREKTGPHKRQWEWMDRCDRLDAAGAIAKTSSSQNINVHRSFGLELVP